MPDAITQRENRIEQRVKELGCTRNTTQCSKEHAARGIFSVTSRPPPGSLVQEQIPMYLPWIIWILGCSQCNHSILQYDGPWLSNVIHRGYGSNYPSFGQRHKHPQNCQSQWQITDNQQLLTMPWSQPSQPSASWVGKPSAPGPWRERTWAMHKTLVKALGWVKMVVSWWVHCL